MSFREKSVIIMLVSTSLIWGYYFYQVATFQGASDATLGDLRSLLILVVVLGIALAVAGHVLIAVASVLESRREPDAPDERDHAINQRAGYSSSFVLATGVFATVVVALVTANLVISINTLLFFFVLSELARFVLQLVYYRRGL